MELTWWEKIQSLYPSSNSRRSWQPIPHYNPNKTIPVAKEDIKKKKSSLEECLGNGIICQGGCWSHHPRVCLKDWMWHWEPWFGWWGSARSEVGLDDLKRSFSAQPILWFCEITVLLLEEILTSRFVIQKRFFSSFPQASRDSPDPHLHQSQNFVAPVP